MSELPKAFCGDTNNVGGICIAPKNHEYNHTYGYRTSEQIKKDTEISQDL